MNKKAEKILESTTSLFVRDGVKKITMDDIAEYSKASKVTIYKYFGDKDTLYFEVGKHIFSDYIEQLRGLLSSEDSLKNKIYGFLDIIADLTDSGKFGLCEELSEYNREIEAEHERYLQTYNDTLLSLIRDGMTNDLIKSGLSRDIVFHYINMGVIYYQQNSEYHNKLRDDSKFQKQFMALHVGNIFTDAGKIYEKN